jgi:hypothetical protein
VRGQVVDERDAEGHRINDQIPFLRVGQFRKNPFAFNTNLRGSEPV